MAFLPRPQLGFKERRAARGVCRLRGLGIIGTKTHAKDLRYSEPAPQLVLVSHPH